MISITNGKKQAQGILIVLFWLTLWQIGSMIVGQDLLLVSPIVVIKTLFSLIWKLGFWSTVAYSFVRIVSGFLLAIIIGSFLAVISASNRVIQSLLDPFFGVIKSIPVASFIILVLIWSGSRNLSIVISFLMVLPIIYTNVLEGIHRADRKLLEMARVFRISFVKRLKAIYFPGVMPYFTAGCKIGLGLCWKSGIAAEVIGLSEGSIGEKLYQAKIFLSTAELFSWTIVIVVISYFFERLFLSGLLCFEKRLQKGRSL
ncbi:MAG: ABC transporter permease subunit [Eubacteriales bacterium]|nr:ABC transporter permease subunit [Eubacteriales bacterium]